MKALEWCGTSVRFLDQTKLPLEELYRTTDDCLLLAEAIRTLSIRGAPLIGVAAGYGLALAGLKSTGSNLESFFADIRKARDILAATRPTAINLFWALERAMQSCANARSIDQALQQLVAEAIAIHEEDARRCRLIGEHGAELIQPHSTILTHCNTGALATGGEGTAQSVITTAYRQGKITRVYADETRPLFQGARLTAWELQRAGIDVILIADNMAATMMKQGKVNAVIAGSDRIASNGDAANKIGTYSVAVLAHHHGIPMYIAAPTSTIDPMLPNGSVIPIEQRAEDELTIINGKRIAPQGIHVESPAFDVTPAELITAIITEDGVFRYPYNFSKNKL